MSERIYSIDTLRSIAIFCVVITHTSPFLGYGNYGNYINFVIDTIGQFAVPFFFMTSGYFLAKTLTPDTALSSLQRTIPKLGSMYLFGILCFFPVLVVQNVGDSLIHGGDVTSAVISRIADGLSPIGFLYYGDSFAEPLWFLTALIFSLCIISLFAAYKKENYLLPTAAVFHFVALLTENYPTILDLPIQIRDALFFGLFYVALGYHLRSANWSPNGDRGRMYLAAFTALLVAQLLEQYVIGYIVREHTLSQEIFKTQTTIVTVFLVLTLFVYVLSNPKLGKGTVLPRVGEYAGGIYLVHYPVYRVLELINELLVATVGVDLTTSFLWHISIAPLVFVISLTIYIFTARIGLIDPNGIHLPRLSRIRDRVQSIGMGHSHQHD